MAQAHIYNTSKLLDPKMDFIFKMIFGNEKHPEIAVSLLNAILYPSSLASRIMSLEIGNPILYQLHHKSWCS